MADVDGRRLLRPEDQFALRFLAEVAVSLDGRHVAWVERRVDERLDGPRSRVLLGATSSGAARPLSPEDATDSAPRFLADGSGLAFLAGRPDGTSGVRVA